MSSDCRATIASSQSAYRRGYSTETSIIRVLNDVYRAADDGSRTLAAGPVGSVRYNRQEDSNCRLEYTFGISGCAIQWLDSYLTDQSQFIRVGSERSSTAACAFGFPQGSILGPLLFSLYVAQIATVIAGFGICHSQYADDTQLYISLKDPNALPLLSMCASKPFITGFSVTVCL